MKETKRKYIYKEQDICTKAQKMAFLKTVKKVNRPRKTDKPGKDRKKSQSAAECEPDTNPQV